MATSIRQARRAAQPRLKVAIDWSNPITRGMTFAAYPIGGTMFDAVSGARGAPSGTTPPVLTNTTGQRGMLHISGAATVSYSDFGALPRPADLALNGGTIFAWGASAGAGGIAERNDNNTVNAGWSAGVDSGGRLNFLVEHSSSNYVKRTTSAVGTGATSMAIVALANPFVDTDTAFYVGGQPASTVLLNGGAGTSGSELARSLYVGRAAFNSAGSAFAGSFNGTLELVAMWNRQLSAAEIASLHANRYQIFRQTSRRSVAYLPSATGVTINLTGTSSTPAGGSVAANRSLTATGAAATGAAGAVGLARGTGLTGTSSVGAPGSASATNAAGAAITGNAAAGNVGVLSVGISTSLAGTASACAPGTVAATAAIHIGLGGVDATGSVGAIYFGQPAVLAEQTPALIITDAYTVEVSSVINNVETSVSL